jgi:hypothetical protein
LPAAEIEGIVAVAVRQILDDEKAILDAVASAEIASNRIPEIIQSASAWSHRLESATECSSALATLVDRVELSPDGFHLTLKLPVQLAQTTKAANRPSIALLRSIPMLIKRRGVELRLVANGDRSKAQKADPALLKAVARAHR